MPPAREPVRDPLGDHAAGRAELALDDLGLAHQRFEDDVLLALRVLEVAAEDLRRRLQLAVDAAVALLQTRGIPRQVEVHEVEAAGLQVDALARGIGADQDAERLVRGIGVERLLDRLAPVNAGDTAEDRDALVGTVGVGDRFFQPPLKPPPRVLVLGEDDQAAVVPMAVAIEQVVEDPGLQPASPCIRSGLRVLGDRQHLVDRCKLRPQVGCFATPGAQQRGLLGGRLLIRLVLRFGIGLFERQLAVGLIFIHPGKCLGGLDGGVFRLLGVGDQPLESAAVDRERPGERRDRRQQALLEPREHEPGLRPLPVRQSGDTSFAQVLVGRETAGEVQFRGVRRQAVDHDRLDDAFGEALAERAKIGLEPAHHDRVELGRLAPARRG